MKILLIGSGGREHSMARKFSKSSRVSKIFVAPGNGGTALEDKCENVLISGIDKLLAFAKENKIDLTVVGPEDPLTEGISDTFKAEGLRIFGPCKNGAMLEGSKSFSKEFMKKYEVKTAAYEVFDDAEKAMAYLYTVDYPIVIKADGLAAGKGVSICETVEEGKKAISDFMLDDIFSGAGKRVVIEEFLEGVEASILSITDGKTIIPFISAKDHKQIYDGGKGPNTGGMGVISPNPYVTDEILQDFKDNIMAKTLEGIQKEGFDYKGIIFFGVMITKKGSYLLEYNVRMGDPETQSVLSLMETDFVDLIEAALDEKLNEFEVEWNNGACCNVVLASKGYPLSYEKGYEITIDDSVKDDVLIAGATLKDGKLLTSGGRVLSVVGVGKDYEEARKVAYEKLQKVNFEGMVFRTDIGKVE